MLRNLFSHPANSNDIIRIVTEHPTGMRNYNLFPSNDHYAYLKPEFIHQVLDIDLEAVTYIHHIETNDYIPISRTGVVLSRGGTFILKSTPLPRSTRSRLIWTFILLFILSLTILVYNQMMFAEDWNSNPFRRNLGERFRQGAALALAIPLYFFPWEKVRFLKSPKVRRVVVWTFGYFLHSLMTLYYVITIFWWGVPVPHAIIGNALLLYSVSVTIICIWLD